MRTTAMNRLLLLFTIIYILPFSIILSQETGGYDDYSYLWADDKKKKKKKKRKKGNREKKSVIDSTQLLQYSDTLKLDSLQRDSLFQNEFIQDSAQVLSTTDDPYDYYFPEEKEKKERVPVDDFRAPLTPEGQGGNFTGGFTYTKIGDESFAGLVLSPEFSIGKVGIGLNIPILYGLDSKSIRTEIFEDGVGPARLIRYIRYGIQKQDPIYVKVGQLDGTMIGYGGLVNNYSNTTSFEKRKVGLHFDVNWKGYAGIEGMYSDFNPSSLNLLVARPYIRPMAFTDIPVVRTFEIGATFLTDKDQTSFPVSDSTSTSYAFTDQGVSAFGIDAGVTVLKVPFIQIDLFANYTSLKVDNDSLQSLAALIVGENDFQTGSGFSFGANFRMHFIADIFSTDIRIERLNYQDYYRPQFFDAVYEIDKDAKLFSLINAVENTGTYGSLTGHILQKVKLGGSLMIPDEYNSASPALVRLHADMDRLFNKFSFHGSYIKGNLNWLGDAFRFDERSLAKMRFIYHMNSFLATGVDYYYAFTQVENGSYQVTKTVMPYFGVSIDF